MRSQSAHVRVQLDDLDHSYRSGRSTIPVLVGVTLRVCAGEWVAVMGASGSGKTTLLHCAAGLQRADRGRVILGGIDVRTASERKLAAMRRDSVGFVFQDFNLLPALTVAQNVDLPLRLGRRRPPRTNTLRALDQVELVDKADTYPDLLSGGQRQRVAIARAMLLEPMVLFADEPTGALDQRSAGQVLDSIRAIVDRGTAVLMVTHDPIVAARADRVVWLSRGRIVDEIPRPTVEEINALVARVEDGTS